MCYTLDSPGSIPSSERYSLLYRVQTASDLSLSQAPMQWAPGDLCPGVKGPRCEADHSPSSSAEGQES
jgi:hypothetical protein